MMQTVYKIALFLCLGFALNKSGAAYGQTKFFFGHGVSFSTTNERFAYFADLSLRVEHKINPAFGWTVEGGSKWWKDHLSGYYANAGITYYKKPSGYWEFGMGALYFDEVTFDGLNGVFEDKITFTTPQFRPLLFNFKAYRHFLLFKYIDFKVGFDNGYGIHFNEEPTEEFDNDLKRSTLFAGFGIAVNIYNHHKKNPYGEKL